MSTETVDTSACTGRPLVVNGDSVGYARYELLLPNIPTQGADSISSVTVTGAGSYAVIPLISFTGGGGTGAAAFASMKVLSAVVVAPGTNISIGTTGTFTGGTFSTAAVATVTHTKVVSATVAAGGTGGTPGTQTVTGTTGTGTKFQASVTVSGGGAITAVLSITVAGNYTVNPTSPAAEPVTGASLTGAQLSVVMGALTVSITTPGRYSVLPTAPVVTSAVFSVTPTYGVDIITVTAGGQDYATPPTVVFSSGAATATSVIGGTNDPITVSLGYTNNLPTANYSVEGIASQAGVISSANKTVSGCDITLTPITGGTLVNGTMDLILSFTS